MSTVLLSYRFNQDCSYFIVTTNKEFKVFSCNPMEEVYKRTFDAGIGYAEMFYRSNILGLIGGGNHPKYYMNKAIIWNDKEGNPIGEFTFKSKVLGIRLRKDVILIVLETKIFVYNFNDFELIDEIHTYPNSTGCCALTSKDDFILVTPTLMQGNIGFKNYKTNKSFESKAHKGTLVAIALSADGKLCATASKTGTLIRIFSTEHYCLLKELRRGIEDANITSIVFNKTGLWLACSSDRRTIHLFKLATINKILSNLNKYKSKDFNEKDKNDLFRLKYIKKCVPPITIERSWIQIRIDERKVVLGFGEGNTIYIITDSGKFYSAVFDPNNEGECKDIECKTLI